MKTDRLDELIQGLFDGTLDGPARDEFNALMLGSRDARDRYRRATALHSVLSRRAADEIPEIIPFPAKRPWKKGLAIAAAVAVLGAVSALMFKPGGPQARIASLNGAVWGGSSVFATNDRIPASIPVELVGGVTELVFPSGAQVTLAGPCRFQIDKPEAITVLHGRVSVHAPPGAQGFRVDTPGGRFVDLGTRFGLAVGSDGANPVILTEVYEGEVRVDAVAGSPTLTQGDARALLVDGSGSRLLNTLDAEPVNVPTIVAGPLTSADSRENLALGKPVASPGYCIRPHGSVFPPENLTDGRTDDVGVPGDWSFWLAPNEENGEFTVDLENVMKVGRISLQNTGNRRIGDRGMKDFEVLVSTDGVRFEPVTSGTLARISPADRGSFPFHDFSFPPVEARYVKVVATSHYRHPTRPASDRNHGGGLNEIRIFSE